VLSKVFAHFVGLGDLPTSPLTIGLNAFVIALFYRRDEEHASPGNSCHRAIERFYGADKRQNFAFTFPLLVQTSFTPQVSLRSNTKSGGSSGDGAVSIPQTCSRIPTYSRAATLIIRFMDRS
jgi:hypothetical protein